MTRIVLLGVSTRALAESAARDGLEVAAVDFFGDRDQARACESYALGRDLGLPLTADGLATAALRLSAEAIVYGANLENHPEVVARLSGKVRVLGNDAATVARVRDWGELRRTCARAGILAPETVLPGEEGRARRDVRWLRKRRLSGGGHGVRRWRGGALDTQHLLQAETSGVPASVAFVADGRRSQVLALTEQLIGRRALGARGFAWCGNVLPFEATPEEAGSLRRQAEHAAAALTGEFGLRGLNGLDCIVSRDEDGEPALWLVEVNPRFTGSMELAERALGVDLYALHVAGCEGRLREGASLPAPAGVVGKGVVYARRAITVPDTSDWYHRERRDIPHAGQVIDHGHPICTVFSSAERRDACLAGLGRQAAAVHKETEAADDGGAPAPPERRGRALTFVATGPGRSPD